MRNGSEKIIHILNKTIEEIREMDWMFSEKEFGLLEEIDDELYAEFKKNGLSITFIGGKSVSIFLYSEGFDGYSQFKTEIGLPIDFTMSRDEVRKLFGQPNAFNAKREKSKVQGDVPIWDRFDFDGYAVHVQYGDSAQYVELITLMDNSVAP